MQFFDLDFTILKVYFCNWYNSKRYRDFNENTPEIALEMNEKLWIHWIQPTRGYLYIKCILSKINLNPFMSLL